MEPSTRDEYYSYWKRAVTRTFDWFDSRRGLSDLARRGTAPRVPAASTRRRMTSLQTDVLVIGGGATGAGVAWDCALRGFGTILVERRDLGDGTSGRFHGLLHSGGRYAVKDPDAARECIEENVVLRRIAADCIEDTGGLFVTTPEDDPAYGDEFVAGCERTGVPAEEIDVAEALRREPRLNPGIRRAFTVPDAGIDAWKRVWRARNAATGHGAKVLPYHRVTGILRSTARSRAHACTTSARART